MDWMSGEKSQRIGRLAAVAFGVSCFLLAGDEPRQKIQVTNTERMDFQGDGVLRLKSSIGAVTVEGWDRSEAEITTVKSTKAEYDSRRREDGVRELNLVRIAAQRDGRDLVISTDFPRYGRFSPPLRGGTHFDLEYRIKVPYNTRLVINHDVGEVFVENLRADIHATVLQGALTLLLPEEGQYAIDARSTLGDVYSDFPGRRRFKPWLIGHQFAQESSGAARKLFLRVGVGDIAILGIYRTPPAQRPPL